MVWTCQHCCLSGNRERSSAFFTWFLSSSLPLWCSFSRNRFKLVATADNHPAVMLLCSPKPVLFPLPGMVLKERGGLAHHAEAHCNISCFAGCAKISRFNLCREGWRRPLGPWKAGELLVVNTDQKSTAGGARFQPTNRSHMAHVEPQGTDKSTRCVAQVVCKACAGSLTMDWASNLEEDSQQAAWTKIVSC